jgi:hypothetical protein
MKHVFLGITICVFASAAALSGNLPPQGYIGLFVDSCRSSSCVEAEALSVFDIWVWALPSENGLICTEFSLESLPVNLFWFDEQYNPDLVEPIWGTVLEGITCCLNECVYDWVWIAKASVFISTTSSYNILSLGPRYGDAPVFLTCDGIEEEAIPSPYMFINEEYCCYASCCGCSTWLYYASAEDFMHVQAVFSLGVLAIDAEKADNYQIYVRENPADTIAIASAELSDDDVTVLLTLESPLIPFVTYTLRAQNIDGFVYGGCTATYADFSIAAIATLLQGYDVTAGERGVKLSWELSSVDEGVTFFVSRRPAAGLTFEKLGSVSIERDGTAFSCLDGGIEFGESYIYRVEYALEDDSGVLFETDAISTPFLPLSLYQNVPNPFNPVTQIRYYLPQGAEVVLEVYDISGRRICRLEEGFQEKGEHLACWDGKDARGSEVASGVYFYRLRAGKETISKKMVLLK